MKKTYIQPATIVATEVQNFILAGSLNLNSDTTTDQLAPEETIEDMGLWEQEW